jgi:hypothetical protein
MVPELELVVPAFFWRDGKIFTNKENMMSIETASDVEINIMIVIDTDYVKTAYPHPSQDHDHPTAIDHNSQFMICNDPHGIISGQGTADLNFKAEPKDTVSFRGISIYGNADDAVIVYEIKYLSGNHVFRPFLPFLVERKHAVVPDIGTPDGLPAKTTIMAFVSLDSKVEKIGIENFYVCFALYTLADDGETQQLFGYYCWDPRITVQTIS